MSTETALFSIALAAMFVAMILFVLFGQVTVRRLRKNPETKNILGLEFASGWDILNVAGALFWPKWLNKKLRNTPLSFLYADAEIIEKHTNLFDKILARTFYFLWISSITVVFCLAIANSLGIFD